MCIMGKSVHVFGLEMSTDKQFFFKPVQVVERKNVKMQRMQGLLNIVCCFFCQLCPMVGPYQLNNRVVCVCQCKITPACVDGFGCM